MTSQTKLATLTRKELVQGAMELGIQRPELLTRTELVQEITRVGEGGAVEQSSSSLFNVARNLIASVVEQGLNLPDAAALIRGKPLPPAPPARAPLATVTLAQIYGAQGHYDKALRTVREVLRGEPDHEAAKALLERLERDATASKGPRTPRPKAETADVVDDMAPTTTPSDVVTSEDVVTPFDVTARSTAATSDDAAASRTAATPDDVVTPNDVTAPPAATPNDVAASRVAVTFSDVTVPPAVAAEPTRRAVEYLAVAWSVDSQGRRGHCELRWALTGATLRQSERHWGPGKLTAQLVCLAPSENSVAKSERVIELSAERGMVALDGIPPHAEVRAAVGWQSVQRFFALKTGLVVEQAGTGRPAVTWTPRAGIDERGIIDAMVGSR